MHSIPLINGRTTNEGSPLFSRSCSSLSFLACSAISLLLFTELIMSSASGSASAFTSFLALPSFFFSVLSALGVPPSSFTVDHTNKTALKPFVLPCDRALQSSESF